MKIVIKIYGPIKEEETWRIGANIEIRDILQAADNVKFTKSIRSYGHVEMNHEGLQSQL